MYGTPSSSKLGGEEDEARERERGRERERASSIVCLVQANKESYATHMSCSCGVSSVTPGCSRRTRPVEWNWAAAGAAASAKQPHMRLLSRTRRSARLAVPCSPAGEPGVECPSQTACLRVAPPHVSLAPHVRSSDNWSANALPVQPNAHHVAVSAKGIVRLREGAARTHQAQWRHTLLHA
jgi:hypothetical protein